MLAVQWSPTAERDFVRIDARLDAIDPVLAVEAAIAVRARVRLLLANPAIGSPLPGGRRKIIKRRFGYVIRYKERGGVVTILRIRHQREDWR